MTAREKQICQKILDALHDRDGLQLVEPMIHAEVQVRLDERVPLAEFDAALALCNARGWLTGVKGKFTGLKWNINDAGEAARLEMA
ncbi:MAG: hypothetical protein WCH99_04890 [Verrucomicrobiota bacterium]